MDGKISVITQMQTLTKSIAGANSKILTLNATRTTINKDGRNNFDPADQTINLEAITQNLSSNTLVKTDWKLYRFRTDNVTELVANGTSSNITFTDSTSFKKATISTSQFSTLLGSDGLGCGIVVEVTKDSFSSKQTISITKNGSGVEIYSTSLGTTTDSSDLILPYDLNSNVSGGGFSLRLDDIKTNIGNLVTLVGFSNLNLSGIYRHKTGLRINKQGKYRIEYSSSIYMKNFHTIAKSCYVYISILRASASANTKFYLIKEVKGLLSAPVVPVSGFSDRTYFHTDDTMQTESTFRAYAAKDPNPNAGIGTIQLKLDVNLSLNVGDILKFKVRRESLAQQSVTVAGYGLTTFSSPEIYITAAGADGSDSGDTIVTITKIND